MKPHCSKRQQSGLTLLEVLVVVFILFFVAVILYPVDHTERRNAQRIVCASNLKEIVLATRIWEGDHHDLYPMTVSYTNGGAMEQAITGDVAAVFQVMSNELSIPRILNEPSTPRILICPADDDHIPATNFPSGFSAKNISYFVGVNASETDPQMLLTGDDNIEIDGIPVNSGLLNLRTNQLISWSSARHKFCGNVAMSDGSVQPLTTKRLQNCVSLATNRIAIP